MSLLRSVACLALLSVLAHAAEPAWLPGGEEVKKAVEARRGKTELSKLAESMKPGTWAELKTEMPKDLWACPPPAKSHSAGYTDDAHWDSRTGQFMYMGRRETRKFIAYSEEKNAWRDVGLPEDHKDAGSPHLANKYGHIYGANAFDAANSRFYHYYPGGFGLSETDPLQVEGISFFDVVSKKWTRLPPLPSKSGFGGQAIEYFSAMNGLVALGKQTWFFSSARQKWESMGLSPVDGYHSMFRHNPYREELLMCGGNNGWQTVARLTKEGKIERLKDSPVTLRISMDKLTVDPVSGRYLILGGGGEGKDAPTPRFYEFDSAKNEYRLLADFTKAPCPFKPYPTVVAFIPEYGVTMWAENKVMLYKHDASANYPVAVPAPQSAADDKTEGKEGAAK